ncbi:DUF455 domain protein [Talaromyces stipitatus ATCC 10500]|uniref:polynucleotide adenylyltransferase n=1 Tax=Talaromyces stipitatus (strain ATCC 10500 / CBS 375.48 / QM 6759 / NRRL 1006) TaxID=441959 RepID=B8MJ56_TALSN|nr:DUF455 domain protein [Talaromyces stipitatus ATCC 10500]EED15718.1 DUF455 domain protein [Talaromyces stipitatus ATCC 10500]
MKPTLEALRDLYLNSFDTALCIIPPTHLAQDINRLRELYDKAYEKWPPHVNLIYPFVDPESLPQAAEFIRSTLAQNCTEPFQFSLDKAGFFTHKNYHTVYTACSGKCREEIEAIRRHILSALGQPDTHFEPHLTIGQSEANDGSGTDYLISKVNLLPPVEWQVSEIFILRREKSTTFSSTFNHMRVWGSLRLNGGCILAVPSTTPFMKNIDHTSNSSQLKASYQFFPGSPDYLEPQWRLARQTTSPGEARVTRLSFKVSSYNVLVDSAHPLSTERHPVLLENLLESSSTADILLLQEVSDNMLSFLLQDDSIRSQYPFCSHGPPRQRDIAPLPSFRNIVVLSRWRFQWEWLKFEKPHKGSVVLQVQDIGTFQGTEFLPLIVAGVHLTCGLTDASISAKQAQVRTVIGHLRSSYPENNWIIAGDFNIPSSSYTIDAALKRKAITARGVAILSSLDTLFAESKLTDCYFGSRATGSYPVAGLVHSTDKLRSVYEGEEGATYDPLENSLAAENSEKSFHCRPQRYDRILIKGDGFQATGFNLFGLPNEERGYSLGSDHWGIRATLNLDDSSVKNTSSENNVAINVIKAPTSLTIDVQFKTLLYGLNMIPSEEEFAHRHQMFKLIESAVHQRVFDATVETRLNISFVVVPVGSYGLGVWDTSSDIDCLVIGTISPRTFMALMVQKLRRPEWQEIHILRKIKAASGTMLELQAGGVGFDLQYCAATSVAESWPKALELPSSDSTFDLPMQSLLKLNAVRDLEYLQRTIPDLATFRKAYRFIKAWAKCRGIYSSKLGYLGGIHITLLLALVCKLSFRESGATHESDILCTFFSYYAHFDWKNDLVYDTTYYTVEPKYHRSSREPLVILSIHPPKVNVAHASTVPSVKTLEEEFDRANRLISKAGVSWEDIAGQTGIYQFLNAYPSYIKVDVQYWAKAVAKGRALFGWLEFRCVSLLVDINRRFANVHARIWPARFTNMKEEDTEDMEEYQGCFLIGLARNEQPSTESATESDRKSAHVSLLSLLKKFAEQIRADETYFDQSCSWVDVSLAKASDLQALRVDKSHWSYTDATQAEDFDSDDDVEEFYDSFSVNHTAENTGLIEQTNPQVRSSRSALGVQVVEGPRLRPAVDVLNRLRWDASFDSADYVVGYIDRFIGEKEIPIDRWKSEQTHEEFIPMHRVLYFKRKSDGERVWDREKRIDLIFNTGAAYNSV